MSSLPLDFNVDTQQPVPGSNQGATQWRPPQWSQPQITSITATLPQDDSDFPTTFYFDAVFHLDHYQELTATRHPIQSGASIVDHAFLEPARLVMEIGMSDAMESFIAGQFTSDNSKSVSAYQTLLQLQSLRIPLTVNTRLNQYQNMLIRSLRAPDSVRTGHGLRVLVTLEEIIVAPVVTNTQSARPDQSSSTNDGTKQPENVPADVQKYLDVLKNGMETPPIPLN